MIMLTTTVMADGQRNLTLHLSGEIDPPGGSIEPWRIDPVPAKFKLTSAVWLIQEKATLLLWWGEKYLMMPMESRNSVRLEHGLHPPKDWNGILRIEALNINERKHIMLMLDFDK